MAVTSLESIFGGVCYWLSVVGCRLLVRLYYTTDNRQPITNNSTPSESEKRQFVITKLLGCKSYAFTR